MTRASLVIALLAATLCVPELASACAVCGFGEDRSRVAYLVTTVFLSLLPLALFGGFLWWLRARAKRSTTPR